MSSASTNGSGVFPAGSASSPASRPSRKVALAEVLAEPGRAQRRHFGVRVPNGLHGELGLGLVSAGEMHEPRHSVRDGELCEGADHLRRARMTITFLVPECFLSGPETRQPRPSVTWGAAGRRTERRPPREDLRSRRERDRVHRGAEHGLTDQAVKNSPSTGARVSGGTPCHSPASVVNEQTGSVSHSHRPQVGSRSSLPSLASTSVGVVTPES